MKLVETPQSHLPFKLRLFFIVVLILGIVLRFYNIDGQVYWHDEALTSSRVSGYLKQEIQDEIFTGEIIHVRDLLSYQRPREGKRLWDTVRVLAIDASEHPPLYYVLLRLWCNVFGFSITAIRSFSALISLLIFPCLYWLCWELFRSPLTGWMAMAIASVSPYFVIYAREARQYSLWTALILLSNILLFRAIHRTKAGENLRGNLVNWGGYAIASALGFYTFLFSGMVAIGQGIYLVLIEKFRSTRSLYFYLLSSLVSVLLFSPWILVILSHLSQPSVSWTAVPLPFAIWLRLLAMHFSRAFIFIDRILGFNTFVNYITLPFIFLLAFYSFYFLYRHTPAKVWLFVVTLTLTLPLFLILPDLILGGQRATSSRYLVPLYLGIQIAIAYLLSVQILHPSFWKKLFWQSVTLLIITSGLISGFIYVNSDTSWNKILSFNNPQIVEAIANSENPLLITTAFGFNGGNTLALSHTLDPDLNLLFIKNSRVQADWKNPPNIPEIFNDIYFLNISDRLR
ncbi:MAG: glycosyltransferase family 39 protein, partial [Cyanobacteria bacterium P01_E01_bin.42]